MESLAQLPSPGQTASGQTWLTLLESPGNWAEASTRILVAPGPHGIAQSLFQVAVKATDSDRTNAVQYLETEELILERVRESRHFLLISDQPKSPDSALRSVPVKGFGEVVAFSATPENIRFGDYPLTFSLHFIYLSHHDGVNQMLKRLQTQPVQNAFNTHHILPIALETPGG